MSPLHLTLELELGTGKVPFLVHFVTQSMLDAKYPQHRGKYSCCILDCMGLPEHEKEAPAAFGECIFVDAQVTPGTIARELHHLIPYAVATFLRPTGYVSDLDAEGAFIETFTDGLWDAWQSHCANQ